MKLARYHGGGVVRIEDEPMPTCPPSGLLVKTEACGLCSGELMDWYMDRKVPHVFGHEVAGIVVESQDERFPIGSRVFPHHHAPCLKCETCQRGAYVHCTQWKATKLNPGGMAEFFGVAAENLNDTLLIDDLRAVDAALIEPLACVWKSFECVVGPGSMSVIGLGVMGLLHLLGTDREATGYDLNPTRVDWARSLGLMAESNQEAKPADIVVICPGTVAALEFGLSLVKPGGHAVLFAPMPPGEKTPVDLHNLYFRDIHLHNAYSCGPSDTNMARTLLRQGKVKAEQVVSNFIGINELPQAYLAMKKGEILKPMVIFE